MIVVGSESVRVGAGTPRSSRVGGLPWCRLHRLIMCGAGRDGDVAPCRARIPISDRLAVGLRAAEITRSVDDLCGGRRVVESKGTRARVCGCLHCSASRGGRVTFLAEWWRRTAFVAKGRGVCHRGLACARPAHCVIYDTVMAPAQERMRDPAASRMVRWVIRRSTTPRGLPCRPLRRGPAVRDPRGRRARSLRCTRDGVQRSRTTRMRMV